MTQPDFIVVGAPKCGTTAIHAYLSQSPHVHLLPKELHYFGRDLRFSMPTPSKVEYESHLPTTCNKQVGEVGIWYLYSETAAREIAEYNPNARIVIMLRNPVDLMYSMHSQAVYSNEECEESFELALGLESDRLSGINLPPLSFAQHAVFYRSLASFSRQIDRYRSHFAADSIHYILLEDLAVYPTATWQHLCRFLNIPPEPVPAFDIVNPNKRQRIKAVGRGNAWIRRSLVPRFGLHRLPNAIKKQAKSALRLVNQANTTYTDRREMSKDLRNQLLAEFEPEIAILESILQRDLGHWRE